MDEGNTADQQQDEVEVVDSAQADESTIVKEGEPAATVSSAAAIAPFSEACAAEIANIGLSSGADNYKGDSCTKSPDCPTQENVISIVPSPVESQAAQSEISDIDCSEKKREDSEETTLKTESIVLQEPVVSKLKVFQDAAISSNVDKDAPASDSVDNKVVAETVEDAIVEEIVEDTSVAETVDNSDIADIVQDAAVAETLKDITLSKTSEVKAVAESIEGAPEDVVTSINNLETTAAADVDESIAVALTFEAGDNENCPMSPCSDKEVDLSDDKVLHIDEDVAEVSHTSCGTAESAVSDDIDKNSSKVDDKPKEVTKQGKHKDQENCKEAVSDEKAAIASKNSRSIEDSIERCIANNMRESSDDDVPLVSSPKKRTAIVTSNPTDCDKFPRNYGFKIITNKIDLCSGKTTSTTKIDPGPGKATFTTIPKLESSGIPLKKLKIKANPIADNTQQVVIAQEGILQEKNAGNDALSLKSFTKGITIAIRKSADEFGEASAPKERPATGLKVRDVESINAAIRTVKAPVSQVLSEDVTHLPDSINQVNEKLPEVTHQATEKLTEVDQELSVAAVCKPGLRPIAPKCEPIASNDPQCIKLIRDLIQLPSVPVYLPDVSDSKHFNGRLHLCHGCGDRFVLLKSLVEHQNRRSCVIKFQCLKCDSVVLCFFNRCEFIRHLYNHNQTLTTVMLQYHITVERLPTNNSGIFDVKLCQECKVFLKVPLPDHMQGLDATDKKEPDHALKCQWCSLMLPTKCSYQAHRRMHFLQAPHICPECGDVSSDLPSFNIHINSVCFHTSKRSLFTCSHCKAEMFDPRKLERHIRIKHIRDVFKCNFCFVACFNLKDLDKHRRQNHEESVAEEEEDGDTSGLKYAFHLCDMCPNRLIRRVRLGQHIWDHTYSNSDVTHVYECRKCRASFSSKDKLSVHAAVCTPGSSAANSQALANGNEILMQRPNSPSSELMVVEIPPLVSSSEIHTGSDFAEYSGSELQAPYMEENDDSETPPPLLKAPVTLHLSQPVPQPVPIIQTAPIPTILKLSTPITQAVLKTGAQPVLKTVTQPIRQTVAKPVFQISSKPEKVPPSLPEKKKKKKKVVPKKSSPEPKLPTLLDPQDDNSFNSFESELLMDTDNLDGEEGGMEVVLNCLECGTNLTSELGSYCTLCEQKREAGTETFKTATLNPLLHLDKRRPPPKVLPRKGNFSCRICNEVISQTCDKSAIKRHFISKHKEIFIAALQTGMTRDKNGSKLIKPNILSHKRNETTTKQGSSVKKSSSGSLCKVTNKKKKSRKPIGGYVSMSDTDDEDSIASMSPPKESKRAKDKKKKSYSPSFPALEEGMVASDEKETEARENVRYCYKCSFKSSDKEEFMAHVTTHKTNPKDLQCPACGMCFVVRPSLEKHLLILHGIKNVDEYLLEHGFPPVEKMTDDVDTEVLGINQCRVCHSKFDSEALLEKHFRTHGSAFLLSKQFRRS